MNLYQEGYEYALNIIYLCKITVKNEDKDFLNCNTQYFLKHFAEKIIDGYVWIEDLHFKDSYSLFEEGALKAVYDFYHVSEDILLWN